MEKHLGEIKKLYQRKLDGIFIENSKSFFQNPERSYIKRENLKWNSTKKNK